MKKGKREKRELLQVREEAGGGFWSRTFASAGPEEDRREEESERVAIRALLCLPDCAFPWK